MHAPDILKTVTLLLALAGLTLTAEPIAGSAESHPAATGRSSGRSVVHARRAPLKLVVLVVIDQLPSWAFDARAGLTRSGLRRLLEDGVVFARARHPYAATVTAAGHATLVTGATPHVTGIIANHLFDRGRDRLVAVSLDAAHPLLGTAGTDRSDGVSPRALRVETVGDRLVRQGGQVVSISFKDRAAVMLGGHNPDLALWYDAERGGLTTSRYYAARLPGWVRALRDERLSDRTPPPPPDWAIQPSLTVGETPRADELVQKAALAAVDGLALGRDERPDLLALSFSSHDMVAHRWGQGSRQSLDVLLRLDRLLGEILALLDRRVGSRNYAVLLTSDHGAARGEGRRPPTNIPAAAVKRAAEHAASTLLGPGDWVGAVEPPHLFLSRRARSLPPSQRTAALGAMAKAIALLRGMAFAAPSAQLLGRCETRSEPDASRCRALHPTASGEILFGAAPGAFISDDPSQITSHGAANDDDALVPVVLLRPGQSPRRIIEEVSVLRVAPTLAEWLGVPPPQAAREAPLR